MAKGTFSWYQVGSVWYCNVDRLLLAATPSAYAVMTVDGDDVVGCVDSGMVRSLADGMTACERFIE